MRSQNKPISIIFILILFGFIPLLPLPGMAATPVVDDTGFITTAGDWKSPTGDLDLLILRENYFTGTVDLTPYDDVDPNSYVVQGNFSTFNHPDCIQSILLRIRDWGGADWVRGSQGTIRFVDGPTSNVQIVGVISDITDTQTWANSHPNLDESDLIFQSPAVASVLSSSWHRGFEYYLS